MASMRSIVHTSPISFLDDDRKIDSSLVDYVDLMFNLMGIDIDYRRFQSMSDSDRKQFIRDLKINKIINE